MFDLVDFAGWTWPSCAHEDVQAHTSRPRPPGALMLARQRQQLILDEVARSGAVKVADLVAELGVSDMTVRRAISELAGRALVDRVPGEAARPRRASVDVPASA